jgi:hypothetical protein
MKFSRLISPLCFLGLIAAAVTSQMAHEPVRGGAQASYVRPIERVVYELQTNFLRREWSRYSEASHHDMCNWHRSGARYLYDLFDQGYAGPLREDVYLDFFGAKCAELILEEREG